MRNTVINSRKNYDRRNAAGGLGSGERTIRRGGWLVFGEDIFYSETLKNFVGWRIWVYNLSDAFSPETGSGQLRGLETADIELLNVWHLARDNKLPAHLEFLRPRLGRLK